MTHRSCIKTQHGQAMVDFVISATFVLVPLLFLIEYLGKVGDIQHRAHEGARYMAWEKAITDKSSNQIKNEMNKRILYGEHRDMDSEQDRLGRNTQSEKIDALYFHADDHGDYTPVLVEKDRSFMDSSSQNRKPDSASHENRFALSVAEVAEKFGSDIGEYNLSNRGLLTATTRFDVMESRYLGLDQAITPTAKNAMYIESWRQTSHDQIKEAVENVSIGNILFGTDPVFEMITTFADLIGFEEFGEFEPGHFSPDAVPCSRVVNGGGDREKACE